MQRQEVEEEGKRSKGEARDGVKGYLPRKETKYCLWTGETDVAHRQISVHRGGNPVLG